MFHNPFLTGALIKLLHVCGILQKLISPFYRRFQQAQVVGNLELSRSAVFVCVCVCEEGWNPVDRSHRSLQRH